MSYYFAMFYIWCDQLISFTFHSRFDGNDIQGYRLYREVNEISKKNAFSDKSCFFWETEATNLDEFKTVAVSFWVLFVLLLFKMRGTVFSFIKYML